MSEVDTRQDLIRRLKRIEGQVRGIQRMLEEERTCGDILAQLSAVNEAVRRVSVLLAEQYAVDCLEEDGTSPSTKKSRAAVAALIDTLVKAPR